jgi:branched-chain amino acid transport system permease protein
MAILAFVPVLGAFVIWAPAAIFLALDGSWGKAVILTIWGMVVVGGIDNPGGAVFGGFLVGVLENVLGAFVIGNELKLAVALVLIIGVLTVKPSGFFGKVHVTRV